MFSLDIILVDVDLLMHLFRIIVRIGITRAEVTFDKADKRRVRIDIDVGGMRRLNMSEPV